MERDVGAGDVHEAPATRVLCRVERILGAGNVRPTEGLDARSRIGDARGVDEGVATRGCPGESAWIVEIADHALDVVKRA